jgi:hypothetical protein
MCLEKQSCRIWPYSWGNFGHKFELARLSCLLIFWVVWRTFMLSDCTRHYQIQCLLESAQNSNDTVMFTFKGMTAYNILLGKICSTNERRIRTVLFGKCKWKRTPGIPRHTWMNNTESDLREIGREVVDWIQPARIGQNGGLLWRR